MLFNRPAIQFRQFGGHGRGRLIRTHHEAGAGLLHELGTVKA
jgi:hypothetical protein